MAFFFLAAAGAVLLCFTLPEAAFSKRWKVGHCAWLAAGHTAAWRRP
jgi:hypothetical protein